MELAGAAWEVDQDVVGAGVAEVREAFVDLVRGAEEGVLLGVGVAEDVRAARRPRGAGHVDRAPGQGRLPDEGLFGFGSAVRDVDLAGHRNLALNRGTALWNVDNFREPARRYLRLMAEDTAEPWPTDVLVFGHTHRQGIAAVEPVPGTEEKVREALQGELEPLRATPDAAPPHDFHLVNTGCWLREADFHLSPTKPDYLSTHGLQFLQQFGHRDAEMGFSESLGVVISMKDPYSPEDDRFDRWLRQNITGHCFAQDIPRATALQTAAYFSVQRRSFVPVHERLILSDMERVGRCHIEQSRVEELVPNVARGMATADSSAPRSRRPSLPPNNLI